MSPDWIFFPVRDQCLAEELMGKKQICIRNGQTCYQEVGETENASFAL